MTSNIKPKNSIAIKICGITDSSQAKAIAEMGVNAIGIIGVKASPRFVPPIQRDFIFSQLKSQSRNLERVLVVADLEDNQFDDLFFKRDIHPTIIQLHGSESQERCLYLQKKYKQVKWWKAIRIKSKEDLANIKNYQKAVDAILIDTWSKISLGGTGKRIPLEWIEDMKINVPWWIAGGISEDWVPKILEKSTPNGIDASSKLEISPGLKDLKKVRLLIDRIRNWEK